MVITKKVCGIILVKGRNDTCDPPTGQSSRRKHWMTEQDPKVCSACEAMQGKIYSLYEDAMPAPPLHPNCRCEIEVMDAVIAGFATKDGINGADWWLKHYGKLPDYYISWDDLYALGYKSGKPPRKYAPGKMVYGGIYANTNGHLPFPGLDPAYLGKNQEYAGKISRGIRIRIYRCIIPSTGPTTYKTGRRYGLPVSLCIFSVKDITLSSGGGFLRLSDRCG